MMGLRTISAVTPVQPLRAQSRPVLQVLVLVALCIAVAGVGIAGLVWLALGSTKTGTVDRGGALPPILATYLSTLRPDAELHYRITRHPHGGYTCIVSTYVRDQELERWGMEHALPLGDSGGDAVNDMIRVLLDRNGRDGAMFWNGGFSATSRLINGRFSDGSRVTVAIRKEDHFAVFVIVR